MVSIQNVSKKGRHFGTFDLACLVGMMATFTVGYMWRGGHNEMVSFVPHLCPPTSTSVSVPEVVHDPSPVAQPVSTSSTSWKDIHEYLIGPDEYLECGPNCGCFQTPRDCPQWYSPKAVNESAAIHDPVALKQYADHFEMIRKKAAADCSAGDTHQIQDMGGYCLTADEKRGRAITHPNGVSYLLSIDHALPSQRLVMGIVDLVNRENVKSINDFGAGIAQYKAEVTTRLKGTPQGEALKYFACDAAGNGNEYTKGMMEYCDLTQPLDLPVADWVISFEVGEHVPSKFEGMVIRNLHRHNRKGIILSWACPGQNGRRHINNHSNEYIIRVFESLGYYYDGSLANWFRNGTNSFWWFEKSLMVFRRLQPGV